MRRIAAVFTLLTAGLIGCGTPPQPTPETVELRTYVVPHGFENDVRRMLLYSMQRGEDPIGRAELGPGGTVVVVAPPGIHRGVQRFIDELEGMDAAPPTPQPVSLTYWIVVGHPFAGGTESVRVAPDSGLAAIEEALEQIAAVQGPTEFRLLERLQLVSTGEDRAAINGRLARLEQRATVAQGQVIADINIQIRQYGLDSQVKLAPGQFVVLGNAGYGGMQGEDAEENDSLYYVITAQVAL
jgi:hypothetical protein